MIRMYNSFYTKMLNRQTISYVFFGLLTTCINIFLFKILIHAGFNYNLSNIITLIVVKIVSYIVNKLFVFRSTIRNFKDLIIEFGAFMLTRGFTMLIDFFGVMLFVEVFHFQVDYSKYTFIIIVTIINYFFGVKVFKKGQISNQNENQ